MSETTKAYVLSTVDDDAGCEIVFAKNRRLAMKNNHPDFWGDCDFIERRCRRAPEFDDATRPTPTVTEHLDRGWLWVCSTCDRFIYGETENLVSKTRGFCNEQCKAKFDALCAHYGWPVIETANYVPKER